MFKVNKLDQTKCWFPKQYRTLKTIFLKVKNQGQNNEMCNLKHTEKNWEKLSVRIRTTEN